MNEASQLTRAYADTVLAPLDRDEATTATRQALEAVLRQSTIRRDRLRIYAPSLRIEKPELRDGPPRRMVRIRIRDRDRGVVHELSIEADKIVDHVIDADANPPFSDEEREDAFRVLSKDSELGKVVARTDIEIEWFNPGGRGRGRIIGARLVRVDDYRVVERVTEVEVELDEGVIHRGRGHP